MVRNWQQKVEKTAARRTEAKQRKQRSDEKRGYKANAQDLVALLGRNGDEIRQRADKSWAIHVWVDNLPSDAPILDVCNEDDMNKGKRRNRSGSIENDVGKKGKNRSNSVNDNPPSSKKKAHPRSKEALAEAEEEGAAPRTLCRHQFFSGKCEDMRSGKKGGCRHAHYSKQFKTLSEALSGKEEILSLSDIACPSVQIDMDRDDPSAMDMIYQFSMIVLPKEVLGEPPARLNGLVVEALSTRSCTMASIVYMTINNALLFDRHREGVVVPEGESFMSYVIGRDESRPRGKSISSKVDLEEHTSLPGSILEHILTFLPDESVASTSCVCRAWHKEIGKVSGFLWRHLIERRGWPLPDIACDQVTGSREQTQQLKYRDAFVSHYVAVRDCKALQSGITGLIKKKSIEEKESCFRSFQALQGAPQYPNSCVDIEVWSENQVLVAYSHDCSLRLFTAVPRSGFSGEKLCKEVICQRADPYKNTKRRTSRLIAMALDKEMIGCLCHVRQDNHEGEAFILTSMNREDFLLGEDAADEDAMQVIDVSQSVLNFLLSFEEVDHNLLRLRDFLSGDDDLEDVEVLVSPSLAGCGYGRFMVEASVSIPVIEENDDEASDANMNMLFRKLFLFSASLGAIVWMGDSDPSLPRHEDIMVTSLRSRSSEGSRFRCDLAVFSSGAPEIMTGSIDPAGTIKALTQIEASRLVRQEIMADGWEVIRHFRRPVVITDSELVVADTLMREVVNGQRSFRSVVSFFPLSAERGDVYKIVHLESNVEVDRLVRVRDDHMIVLCREYGKVPELAEGGDEVDRRVAVYTIIIDLHSKREIGRICLVEDLESQLEADPLVIRDLPMSIAFDGDTVAAGLWWKGVVITGEDVRSSVSHGQLDESLRKASKKKKNTPGKKGEKKNRNKKAHYNG
jgi:hypothetical protein